METRHKYIAFYPKKDQSHFWFSTTIYTIRKSVVCFDFYTKQVTRGGKKKPTYFSQKNTGYILEIESRINTIIFCFVVLSLCRQDRYDTESTFSSIQKYSKALLDCVSNSEAKYLTKPAIRKCLQQKDQNSNVFLKCSFGLARNQKLGYEVVLYIVLLIFIYICI